MSFEKHSGYRLIDLEIFNWGTFDGTVWHLPLDGHGCLLTGENGTGKSTIIDAFLSLLVPNKRRSYNMSSGSARRERNETTYVRGAYQREKTQWDQIKVKYLRNEQSLSALAAHFANPLTKDKITLAQFFWFESGDLRKCLVISHGDFSLKPLLNKVKTPTDLRANLRQLPHTTIFSSFNEYQDYFVRYVGLRSYKGMDLFNQVSTIKQIGCLNDFVRQNMLEDTDMEPFLHEFFHTFEDLTLAHEAIVNARLQIENLDGIDKDARKFNDVMSKFEQNARLQTYLPRYFSAQQYDALKLQQQNLTENLASHQIEIQLIEHSIDTSKAQLSALTRQLDDQGRQDRLNVLQRELNDAQLMYQSCQNAYKKLEIVRAALNFSAPLTPELFAKEQLILDQMKSHIEANKLTVDEKIFSLKQEENQLQKQLNTIKDELLATQKNKTLIPPSYLQLRTMLCEQLNLSSRQLLFAAELMAVKASDNQWKDALEKLLRPLALKLLVPADYFMQVNQIVRCRNIGMKIVLQSITMEPGYKTEKREDNHNLLISKLEFLSDAKQVPWLQNHIREQFAYQCVDDMQTFHKASRAITVEGLIKRHTHISEKDDRSSSHAQHVLGWAHEERVQQLANDSRRLREQLNTVQQQLKKIVAENVQQDKQLILLAQREFFDTFDTVNIKLWEEKIKTLETQRVSLIKKPEIKAVETIQQQLNLLAQDRDQALAKGAVIRNDLAKIPIQLERLSSLLETFATDETLDVALQQMIIKVSAKNQVITNAELEGRLAEMLRNNMANLSENKQQLSMSLIRKMTAFKAKFPEASIDMEASLDDLPIFLQRYQTLKKEDLPTHETRFKKLISRRVITDLTAFKSTLELSSENIKENIEQLNLALKNIAYSDTTYVQIRMTKTKDTEIREFQAILRNAIQMTGTQKEEIDLEESFQRIRNMITRLKSDMKWSARVTNVRNWTDFFVVELNQENHQEVSFYSDSAGLSGGQKAKLAFTILASALAYQYGLNSETVLEKSFRFVVIDEAFSKSDDSNSQYALELFKQLGLQLLVVTPLDKLNIIKPYVHRIFVTQIPRKQHRSELGTLKINTTLEKVSHNA